MVRSEDYDFQYSEPPCSGFFAHPWKPWHRAQVGTVRGEDYDFQFSGRVREGRLHFRLNMEYVGDDEGAGDERPPDPPPDHRWRLPKHPKEPGQGFPIACS